MKATPRFLSSSASRSRPFPLFHLPFPASPSLTYPSWTPFSSPPSYSSSLSSTRRAAHSVFAPLTARVTPIIMRCSLLHPSSASSPPSLLIGLLLFLASLPPSLPPHHLASTPSPPPHPPASPPLDGLLAHLDRVKPPLATRLVVVVAQYSEEDGG